MSTGLSSPHGNLKGSAPQRWLLIRHSQKSVEDRCTLWLAANGISFDECVPIAGDVLPPMDAYDRLVVFGGVPQLKTHNQPSWMRQELHLIERALVAGIPCLGICLGGQLLAHVLGARVQAHPQGLREVGYHTILPTKPSPQFLTGPSQFLQWHSYGFDVPEGCEHLAKSRLFACQAFRHPTNSYGLQFHPEVTNDLLLLWQRRHREAKAAWLSPFDRCRHRLDSYRYSNRVTKWFNAFLQQWSEPARSPC